MKRGFFNHLTATFAKVGKSAVWVCTFIRGVIYLEDSRMFFFFAMYKTNTKFVTLSNSVIY